MTTLRGRARRAVVAVLSPLVPPLRSLVTRRRRTAAFVEQVLYRFPPLVDALFGLARGDPRERYRRWVARYDTLDDADLDAIRAEVGRLADSPLFLILVPLDGEERSRADVVQSLRAQVYDRWQVEFVGAALAGEWNAALRASTADFVVVLDPAAVLRPHALFLLAREITRNPDVLLVYGDDDELDDAGARSRHYFKPDWNEALLRCQNYLGGVVCFRRAHALTVGGCEEELDGNCAWGLFLRLTAGAADGTVRHLPFVLSHRRPPSHADAAQRSRVARALENRLARIGERAEVEPVGQMSYRTRYAPPDEPPLVSVIVPTTCRLDVLEPCVDSLLNRTSYDELELLLVVNGIDSGVAKQRRYLDDVTRRPGVRTLFYDERPYNFSKTNNWAAAQAGGELLCFLNDDTEAIHRGWLAAMVAQARRDRVGAVGAMLVYPNGRIQHAGVVLGVGHVAGHTYARQPRGIAGYHDRALVDQDVSCVTAACMLVRRDVFTELGGFDEALAIAFNDIDFCLRLRKAGWRVVWTPNAELYHRESASLVRHDSAEREAEWAAERDLMHARWGSELLLDPHYNPNLSLDALRLWEPAFPPRVAYPWKRTTAPVAGLEEPQFR